MAASISDVLIVGAGLAGTSTATILARSGLRVALLDVVDPLPYCFKAEKLGADQVERFRRLGMNDVEPRGIFYHDLINGLRRQLPRAVDFRIAKVRRIVTGSETQQVEVEGGETFTARLVVLSAGVSGNLLTQLGITRRMLSRTHCMAFGFALAPHDGRTLEFEELFYKADHTESRIAFISFFQIGQAMRANMFAYWDAGDANVREFLADPMTMLGRLLPAVSRVTGPLRLVGRVDRCPSHLQTVEGHVQPGVVLIGDSFQTNCPATATGMTKVLNDVECLCLDHIPRWLSTPGMSEDKIAQFYEDPRKTSYDSESLRLAMTMRKTATDSRLPWRLRRMARSWKRTANAWWKTYHAARCQKQAVAFHPH